MITVLLVDDEAMVRAGLRLLVDGEPDLQVVGEAVDGADGVRAVERLRPQVVLLDVRMPGMSGLQAAQAILAENGPTKVIMLTTFDEDEVIDVALRAGVTGFLLKSSPPEQLVAAVRAAAEGRGALDPGIVPRVIDRYAAVPQPPAPDPGLARLTPRETDVLRLVAGGHNNAEIAAALYLGETTVKTHLGRVLDKLGLRDRAQAIAYAYRSGLVAPGD
jgi:DNA-binding NarL/FixJ family response regulator